MRRGEDVSGDGAADDGTLSLEVFAARTGDLGGGISSRCNDDVLRGGGGGGGGAITKGRVAVTMGARWCDWL